jgi:XTP/dITP diphosphohydrolase
MKRPPLVFVFASSNRGKVREVGHALAQAGIEVVGLEALSDATLVEEHGTTFEENARAKAEEYSSRASLPVLADDSGLEVDALGGEPGVASARFGGRPELDDTGRNRLLLERLRAAGAVEPHQRTARFRCVLALAHAGRTLATFDGVVEGMIVHEPRGANGFGYDPLFFHPASGCTTAELSTEQKQAISHRGQALAALLAALQRDDPRLAPLGLGSGPRLG